jgi:Putative zinc-finger
MTHLELENLVSDYLEGVLGSEQERQVSHHLAECHSCRELIEDVRRAMQLCRSAEDLKPSPWLASRILLATAGAQTPTLRDRIAAALRAVWQPRFAYGIAMAVFSFSIIVNAAGVNLRDLRLEDLNPHTWIHQASRNGHLVYARAEKFYYDLRVVYEIEWRLKQLRQQPGEADSDHQQAPPKDDVPGGSSTNGSAITRPEMAFNRNVMIGAPALLAGGPAFLPRSTTQ